MIRIAVESYLEHTIHPFSMVQCEHIIYKLQIAQLTIKLVIIVEQLEIQIQ